MIQNKPRCFECGEVVSPADLIYAPPCGSNSVHDECGSAVWHPLCLMRFREALEMLQAEHEQTHKVLAKMFRKFFGDEDDESEAVPD